MIDLAPLHQLRDIEIRQNENLTSYSTMRLEGVGTIIIIRSEETLQKTVQELSLQKSHYRILGKGSNQLLPETSPIPYLLLDLPFDSELLNHVSPSYLLPASIPLQKLTTHAIRFGIKGWEVFSGIPGSLGGAVFMNAGTGLGEIGELIQKVFIINRDGDKREEEISPKSSFFAYRRNLFCHPGDVIYKVEITHLGIDAGIPDVIRNYLRKRSKEQPLNAATCGCVFKNCSDKFRAGKMIDELGLKGLCYHHFRISPKHANFIEHLGGGTYTELLELIAFIQDKVKTHYGLDLELEVET